MSDGIELAWAVDIEIGLNGGEGVANKTGYKVEVKEIEPNVAYKDSNVKVIAFQVPHGKWQPAYGYSFETVDKVIVVSGDTSAAPEVIKKYCNGCDILIHEAFAGTGVLEDDFGGKRVTKPGTHCAEYMANFHTSAKDAGLIAQAAGARRLIITHAVLLGPATERDIVKGIASGFHGPVAVAKDLEVF